METRSAWHDVRGDGARMAVHVTEPRAQGKYPGIMLLHHAPGVNHQMERYAERIASEGFVCVIPDLYYRWGSRMVFVPGADNSGLAQAISYVSKITDFNLAQDFRSVLNFLESLDSVQADRVGVVGYCIGGRMAYLAACFNTDVKAAVVCYGTDLAATETGNSRPLPLIEMAPWLQCPMLSLSGDRDSNPSPEVAHHIAETMRVLGKNFEYQILPGGGHAFFSEDNAAMYHRPSAERGWVMVLEFLKRHLQEAPTKTAG